MRATSYFVNNERARLFFFFLPRERHVKFTSIFYSVELSIHCVGVFVVAIVKFFSRELRCLRVLQDKSTQWNTFGESLRLSHEGADFSSQFQSELPFITPLRLCGSEVDLRCMWLCKVEHLLSPLLAVVFFASCPFACCGCRYLKQRIVSWDLHYKNTGSSCKRYLSTSLWGSTQVAVHFENRHVHAFASAASNTWCNCPRSSSFRIVLTVFYSKLLFCNKGNKYSSGEKKSYLCNKSRLFNW